MCACVPSFSSSKSSRSILSFLISILRWVKNFVVLFVWVCSWLSWILFPLQLGFEGGNKVFGSVPATDSLTLHERSSPAVSSTTAHTRRAEAAPDSVQHPPLRQGACQFLFFRRIESVPATAALRGLGPSLVAPCRWQGDLTAPLPIAATSCALLQSDLIAPLPIAATSCASLQGDLIAPLPIAATSCALQVARRLLTAPGGVIGDAPGRVRGDLSQEPFAGEG